MLAVLLLVLAGSALPVRAQDMFTVRVTNERAANLIVEIRDAVCDNEVRLQDRMDPGATRKVRVCKDANGLGQVIAVVAGGCASAQEIPYPDLARGAEIKL